MQSSGMVMLLLSLRYIDPRFLPIYMDGLILEVTSMEKETSLKSLWV